MDTPSYSSPQPIKRPTFQSFQEWIMGGLDKRLVLLVVPQKGEVTDWIYQVINQIEGMVVWITLDQNDNQPAVFQARLAALMENLSSGGCQDITGTLAQPGDLEDWIVSFINQVADWPSEIVLVLEDYQVIVKQEIHNAMAYLLDYLPPQGHVIIISQCEPPLPLGHWRVRRQMVEINLRQNRNYFDNVPFHSPTGPPSGEGESIDVAGA